MSKILTVTVSVFKNGELFEANFNGFSFPFDEYEFNFDAIELKHKKSLVGFYHRPIEELDELVANARKLYIPHAKRTYNHYAEKLYKEKGMW